ncbi:hypothetical protein [Paenibacillus sp. GYB003]|uniref:hypothetical protein n=1 Tax=Paenibacillus sp. GYB003 TaxID=2994392 RepID=UPI002F96B615
MRKRNKKEERFIRVTELLGDIVVKAQNKHFKNDPAFSNDLDLLFSTSYWGFREITLVVVVARLLDSNFKASEAFYECHPRPLFEHPIRHVLLELNIPRRKSGPLNVAKATVGINDEWAGQRRPAHVAAAVVRLVQWIETVSRDDLENFAVCLMTKFIDEAKKTEALNVELEPQSDPEFLFMLCSRLIQETPDAGNTPQRIFGLLLHSYHETLGTGIIVTGFEDRASTTSTTSKKPGDVNEETLEGGILKVYEVTVKPFNQQRISESYEALKVYNETHSTHINEVIVVCRKSDVPEGIITTDLNGVLGKFVFQDTIYYFVDIFEWILLQLLKMPTNSKLFFYDELHEYVRNSSTSLKVKNLWRSIHTVS